MITTEHADCIIENAGLADLVEDYEHDERGHVYFLSIEQVAIVHDNVIDLYPTG